MTERNIQHLLSRSSEMHHKGSLAGLTAKLLAKQVGDIRLVIHNQDADTHDAASAIVAP